VFLRSLSLVAALGCQSRAEPPAPAPVVLVEVHDATSVVATVRPDRPCRATVGPIELIVGKTPFVAELGDTHWTGERGAAGMFFLENGTKVARVAPDGDPAAATVFDPTGAPVVVIAATATAATVSDGTGRVLRTLTKRGLVIAVSQPVQTVTGTSDLVLAALITAQELEPEIRMLAACDRVLGKEP
jgi:hypothetical protein